MQNLVCEECDSEMEMSLEELEATVYRCTNGECKNKVVIHNS